MGQGRNANLLGEYLRARRELVAPEQVGIPATRARGTVGGHDPPHRVLWARRDVADRGSGTLTLDHPQVGELRLDRDKLAVNGTDGIVLVVHQPRPDTDAADELALLASASAPTPRADTRLG